MNEKKTFIKRKGRQSYLHLMFYEAIFTSHQ